MPMSTQEECIDVSPNKKRLVSGEYPLTKGDQLGMIKPQSVTTTITPEGVLIEVPNLQTSLSKQDTSGHSY